VNQEDSVWTVKMHILEDFAAVRSLPLVLCWFAAGQDAIVF